MKREPEDVEGRGQNRLLAARDDILRIVADDRNVERPIEAESRLAREIEASKHDVAKHFLSELPKHCNMLATAVADALTGLDRLEPGLAFSGVVLARGLVEAAADLYWLSEPAIGGVERTRRTFLIYLRQHETDVRQLEQISRRVPAEESEDEVDPDKAIAEGWLSLKRNAEAMASAGFRLRTTKQKGAKYVIGDVKPPISELVDKLITDNLGLTGLNVYTSYSATAHAEGGGLGALLTRSDRIETTEGIRYARGFDEATWEQRVVRPAASAAAGAVGAWAALAYPARLRPARLSP